MEQTRLFDKIAPIKKGISLPDAILRGYSLKKELSAVGYHLSKIQKNDIGIGTLFHLYFKKDKRKKMNLIVIKRPLSYTMKDFEKNVILYPRINVSVKGKEFQEWERFTYMINLYKQENMHFLIVAPFVTKEHRYWVASYSSLEKEHWINKEREKEAWDRFAYAGTKANYVLLPKLTELLTTLI